MIDVPDIDTLARLAKRYALLILHGTVDGRDVYVIQDESTTYRYLGEAHSPQFVPSYPPSAAQAGARPTNEALSSARHRKTDPVERAALRTGAPASRPRMATPTRRRTTPRGRPLPTHRLSLPHADAQARPPTCPRLLINPPCGMRHRPHRRTSQTSSRRVHPTPLDRPTRRPPTATRPAPPVTRTPTHPPEHRSRPGGRPGHRPHPAPPTTRGLSPSRLPAVAGLRAARRRASHARATEHPGATMLPAHKWTPA